jgi:hypothetical protein
MKINIPILIILLASSGFISCSKKQPEKMNKEAFSRLYAHLMLVSEEVPPASDSLAQVRRQKIDSLFTAWTTTEKDFREMVSFYQQTPEEWARILRKAGQELDSIKIRSR